jgi:hypothetical protein
MGLLKKAAAGHESSHGGLLKKISKKQYKKNNSIPQEAPSKKTVPSSPMEKAVVEKLFAGFARFGIFQGVILEALKYSAGEFSGRLSFMVSGFGVAQGLAPGRALVLFDSKQDGELIGRHLAKTVPGNTIFIFQAKTPQEAFNHIKPYI